jgi:hypothetical protein
MNVFTLLCSSASSAAEAIERRKSSIWSLNYSFNDGKTTEIWPPTAKLEVTAHSSVVTFKSQFSTTTTGNYELPSLAVRAQQHQTRVRWGKIPIQKSAKTTKSRPFDAPAAPGHPFQATKREEVRFEENANQRIKKFKERMKLDDEFDTEKRKRDDKRFKEWTEREDTRFEENANQRIERFKARMKLDDKADTEKRKRDDKRFEELTEQVDTRFEENDTQRIKRFKARMKLDDELDAEKRKRDDKRFKECTERHLPTALMENANPPTADMEPTILDATPLNTDAEHPTDAECTKNTNPPTAHVDHPKQDATQPNTDATEHPTKPTDSIECVKNTNPTTAHMEYTVQDTQPNTDTEHPTKISTLPTARIEHTKNINPPIAHTKHPEDATLPTDSIEYIKNTNPPTAHMEHPTQDTTQPNTNAGCPTKCSTLPTARIEHAKNTNPPTAHMEHPIQDTTQPNTNATEHPTSPTDSIEHANANPPTVHMEHPIQDATQPNAITENPTQDSTPPTAHAECPIITLLKLPSLPMKLLPRKLNDFLSFPTPPDPLDPLHRGLATLFMTLLHPFY